ncbi:MAG: 2-oxoglutarate and iron-dependent oxygenase domain-containing protein [Pseudomonadota bacterium]
MKDSVEIPVVDLAPYFEGTDAGKASVARAVDEACCAIGFLVISGHGIDETLIESMREVSRRYFDLPVDEKLRLKMPTDCYRGYTPIGTEGLAASLDQVAPPDLKESFSIGPVDAADDEYHSKSRAGPFFATNMWPEQPAEMREIWEAYYRVMESLATSLMRIFALALDLPEHWFDDKVDRHITNFSVIHYPEPKGEPIPGQLRAGAHTDYGSLTILQKDEADGGLQVQRDDGSWIDVPNLPGTFVVNLGDLMAEWTNDRWRSTMHRVVLPDMDRRGQSDRYSMPFFHQPNYDAVVECIPTCCSEDNPARYGKTTSGEHVVMKINKHRAPDQVGETV